jgi:hypothetical protein
MTTQLVRTSGRRPLSMHSLLCRYVIQQLLTGHLCTLLSAETLYETLGVAQDASERDIKKAYRQKALKLHPDVNKAVRSGKQSSRSTSSNRTCKRAAALTAAADSGTAAQPVVTLYKGSVCFTKARFAARLTSHATPFTLVLCHVSCSCSACLVCLAA